MSRTKKLRRLGIASAVATLATLAIPAAPAQAYYVDYLCRATSPAPIYNANGYWMYTIQPGHDMRVSWITPEEGGNNDVYFGHGANSGHSDGHTWAQYFGGCRAG